MSETMLRQSIDAHGRLDACDGHWRAETVANAAGDPRLSAIEDGTSAAILEWMPDGFFLVHRWDATLGEAAFKGTEVLGYEPARGDYFTRFFDHASNDHECTASVDGNVLTLVEPNTRATVAVTEEGTSVDITWEWREDGSNWLPPCDLVSRPTLRSQDAN